MAVERRGRRQIRTHRICRDGRRRAASSPGWRRGPLPGAPIRSAFIWPAWARPSWAISNMAARIRAGRGEIADKLHLHARSIDIGRPDGGRLQATAPLPPHMVKSWTLAGLRSRRPPRSLSAQEDTEKKMKRFYKEVSIAPVEGGFCRFAGRQVRKDAGAQCAGAADGKAGGGHCRGMARAGRRDHRHQPCRCCRLANSVIDGVAANREGGDQRYPAFWRE